MKKLACLLLVMSFIALCVASFAAEPNPGAGQGERKKVDPALVCAGIVKSIAKEGDVLKSFVVTTAETPEKPATDVTIDVTDKTRYRKGKEAATAADVVVGAKVTVRLKSALAHDTGTAVIVGVANAPLAGDGQKVADPALVCAGVVKSLTKDGDALKSFVVTTDATPGKPAADVTISVTDTTKYMKAKTPGTAADVVVGAKVMVRLKAALADGAGTAAVVRIMPALQGHAQKRHRGNP